MNTLVNNLEEVTSDRDQQFSALASIKFDYIDLKNSKKVTDEENNTLKEQVDKLVSTNQDLRSDQLKRSSSQKEEISKN